MLAEEKLILDATELISRLMAEQGISRAELAKKIKRTRGYVTQLLSGDRNMTLRTLAALLHVLGAEVRLTAQTASQTLPQHAAGYGSHGYFVGSEIGAAVSYNRADTYKLALEEGVQIFIGSEPLQTNLTANAWMENFSSKIDSTRTPEATQTSEVMWPVPKEAPKQRLEVRVPAA
jgi:transcriptional regulator with XRE-family HTH domain